ncbi:DNA cytosine methyltransferase [Chroococcus sp. FPU101]|uniref:DNA cytosine methyltransferase n=1 Tax=Chroococcus sp. FPU101 TaxID=1974212 RepID=UPI001A9077BB|nr:DNA (cytosine-5-)-methyltransferase [Chroococcus sp. FPU101]GFE72261.1 hypothetical protein CFPU101_48710 [Chroococcus sp. FPU101]
MLTQLDLCSGVGAGFPLDSIGAGGFELVGLSEIDEYCSDILFLRFPGVTNYGDVRSLPVREIRRQWNIDIITASPPCQPFSVQGKRKGADDKRDCLPAIIRAITSIRPKFFCLENVSGLLSCPYFPGEAVGSYFRNLLTTLAERGYDAEWLCVSSGHFGSPFIRERLLLVGVARSLIEWSRATPWPEQVRGAVEEIRGVGETRGIESPISREGLQLAFELDRPAGVKSGDEIVRNRREALGNALDPRVASVALRRVLYLDFL